MIKRIVLLLVFISASVFAQPVCTKADSTIFLNKLMFLFEHGVPDNTPPTGELNYLIGTSFIGTEYEAHTLSNTEKEELVIHLSGLDCYTFTEACLAFTRTINSGEVHFEKFYNEIENIRYRGGKMDGYTSRLHYTSEWIYDLDKRGIVEDVTEKIGGEPYTKHIHFMTGHAKSYPQLKDNPENVEKMKQVEAEINKHVRYYVPQDKIEAVEKNIKAGDIIALTTGIEGLDIVHVGIAAEKDGRIHFMHAPNVGYKVQITDKPLAEYVKGVKSQTGVMVARIK